MHILEFDWRRSPTDRVLDALDRSIEGLSKDYDDGLDQLEHGEELVGLGLAALQAYVNGVQADLRRVFPQLEWSDADLRHHHSETVSGVTIIEGIWSGANYYKHHDEWDDWSPTGHRRLTVSTLEALGISAATEFPCVVLARALQGGHSPLADLLETATRWRDAWFLAIRCAEQPN
jgi:hypothetical protein